MMIIVDRQKQLNYHPLIVYFMLQPEDYAKYANHLRQLNRYLNYTHGIFKFRAVQRGEEYSQYLTDNLAETIKQYNVIVRLVDDYEGNFNYALFTMDFSQDPALFEKSLQNFIIEVCEQNVKNLNEQLQHFQETNENEESQTTTFKMIDIFRYAIKRKGTRDGIWRMLTNPDSRELKLPSFIPERLPSNIDEVKKSIYKALPNNEAKENFKFLIDYFESRMNAPDTKDSDRIVQGTVDKTCSEKLIADHITRLVPETRPDITIAIKIVTTKVLKDRTSKAWGVEININGETIPVYMGSVAAYMVYVCTLLKQKMGTHLFRTAFKRSLPGKNSYVGRHADVKWLEQVYRLLYPLPTIPFDTWYIKMQKNSCHEINQGKSNSIRIIKEKLKKFPYAIEYCSILTAVDENQNTYYHLDIPAERIIIPEELQKALGK